MRGFKILHDRRRLVEHEAVFFQRRHAAVGIEREIFGATMLARGHVDEDRFVLHALFEQRDQHASRVRRKRVVMQADHRQRSWSCGAADHSAAVCGASGAIRTQAAFGICAYRKTSQTNSAAIMPVCAQYAAVEPPLICLRRSADRFTAESPSTVAASATSAIGTASRIIDRKSTRLNSSHSCDSRM